MYDYIRKFNSYTLPFVSAIKIHYTYALQTRLAGGARAGSPRGVT